jgi:deoxycytidylate deaminase
VETFSPIDKVMMQIAGNISTLASCTHRNVGALVVSFEGRIWGHGYAKAADRHKLCTDGGCPRGLLPAGQGEKDYSDCITVHAEVNAITMSGDALCDGSTLYVNSYPCPMCWRIAEGSGLYRVVWTDGDDLPLQERQFV